MKYQVRGTHWISKSFDTEEEAFEAAKENLEQQGIQFETNGWQLYPTDKGTGAPVFCWISKFYTGEEQLYTNLLQQLDELREGIPGKKVDKELASIKIHLEMELAKVSE